MAAIKIYSKDDFEVQLFGRILKNTVDEDFWATQEAYRGTLYDTLKQTYRERLATKQLTEVNRHVEEVATDKAPLDPWVQSRIVERLVLAKD